MPFSGLTDEKPSDGYNTLEWLTTQPWCNGTIGTLGGFTDAGVGAAVTLTDGKALSVIGLVSVNQGAVTLTTTTGDLTIAGPVTTETLTIGSAAKVLETAAGDIDVNLVNVTAQTGIDLDSTSNSIQNVGADSTASGKNVITK